MTRPSYAKTGNNVTVTIVASELIAGSGPGCSFTVGGVEATGDSRPDAVGVAGSSGRSWTCTYTLVEGDTDGPVGFTITGEDLAGNSLASVTAVTEGGGVVFDQIPPTLSAVEISTNENSALVRAIGNPDH